MSFVRMEALEVALVVCFSQAVQYLARLEPVYVVNNHDVVEQEELLGVEEEVHAYAIAFLHFDSIKEIII